MSALFGRIWGWIAGAAALIVVAAGFYLRGRSTGRADERQERDTAVYWQDDAELKATPLPVTRQVVPENEKIERLCK